MPQGKKNLRPVELGSRLGEAPRGLQVEEELTPVEEVQNHVKLGLALEGVPEAHQEGVLHRLKDVPLGLGVLQLVALKDGILV